MGDEGAAGIVRDVEPRFPCDQTGVAAPARYGDSQMACAAELHERPVFQPDVTPLSGLRAELRGRIDRRPKDGEAGDGQNDRAEAARYGCLPAGAHLADIIIGQAPAVMDAR